MFLHTSINARQHVPPVHLDAAYPASRPALLLSYEGQTAEQNLDVLRLIFTDRCSRMPPRPATLLFTWRTSLSRMRGRLNLDSRSLTAAAAPGFRCRAVGNLLACLDRNVRDAVLCHCRSKLSRDFHHTGS